MKNDKYHESVLTHEVEEFLNLENSHIKKQVIDATVGTGGHAVSVVKSGARVLGIDLDPKMLEIARDRLNEALRLRSGSTTCPGQECFELVQGNFRDIDKIASEAGLTEVDGIVLDLGVSNLHLTDEGRGFSFRDPEASLDMRLDPDFQGVKASDLLNVLREDQLRELFEVTMSPLGAKKLSEKIIFIRTTKKFEKVGDLFEALEGSKAKPGLHFATLPLLALRIAVNSELDNLKEALPKAFSLLKSGGRLLVISFHSKEDEIVKDYFKSKRSDSNILTEMFIAPSLFEIEKNPRSRSARLRVIEKH